MEEVEEFLMERNRFLTRRTGPFAYLKILISIKQRIFIVTSNITDVSEGCGDFSKYNNRCL